MPHLAAGMESLVVPQSEKWHNLTTAMIDDDDETDEEKEWAEDVRDNLPRAFSVLVAIVIGTSMVVGYSLASLDTSVRNNFVRIEEMNRRLLLMEELVAGVDVYNLRIETLERQIAVTLRAINADDVRLHEFEASLKVLEERSRHQDYSTGDYYTGTGASDPRPSP